VLGHFCTGVTVITAHDGERPAGFACQSFAALSLDPPLVLFCPARTSRSWPAIERAGRFAVNVLAEDQREVSSVFGSRGADKFEFVRWHSAASGAPLLDGALAWMDCTVDAVHEACDHLVVVGRVVALGDTRDTKPPAVLPRRLRRHRGHGRRERPGPRGSDRHADLAPPRRLVLIRRPSWQLRRPSWLFPCLSSTFSHEVGEHGDLSRRTVTGQELERCGIGCPLAERCGTIGP
jgi:3-hydroxy-9,10-secoandrosta-1,3,5(10)-triene-9,17-dione monooxygenase reductase component